MINKITLFILSLLISTSCINNSNKGIKVDIPTELQGNKEAVALINDMTSEITKIKASTGELFEMTGGKDIDSTSELSKKQTLIMMKAGLKMAKASHKVEKIRESGDLLKQNLTASQAIALDNVFEQLEHSISEIDFEKYGFDEEELMAMKEEEAKEQAAIDSINALREEAIQAQKDDGTYVDYSAKKSNEIKGIPKILSTLFPLAVLGLAVFMVFRGIKRFRGRIKDIGYSVGEMKDTAQDLLDKSKSGSNGELSEEEKTGLGKIINMFDNKN